MSTKAVTRGVRIPAWVKDLDSFRRWTRAKDFPEQGWISYLAGELWVDPSMERSVHNQMKSAFALTVGGLVLQQDLGTWYPDRMRLVHVGAELSTEPDGMFLSHEAIHSGRVILEKGDDTLEILGTPDMVLEVISSSSVEKDTKLLRELYWEAGVTEYWLADSREKARTFDVLRHGKRGYVTARKQDGWINSTVFGKAFHLTERVDEIGLTKFRLEMR
jgi:Uma2 family endonuclease